MSESCICLKSSTGTIVPLKTFTCEVDIKNQNCQLTFLQTFENEEADPIEAYYVFPVSAGSTAYDFSAEINGRIVQTQIKEKEKAVAEYNEAISKGQTAYMMEKVDGNVFSVCLGNIPPKTKVNICIRCCMELENEIDSKCFRTKKYTKLYNFIKNYYIILDNIIV
jgi:hypothetical protein